MVESVSCSVVSSSLWPRGLQPIRPLCPRDSPGKNTGVGCHSFLQGISPTQGSNPDLLHCSWVLYHLNHQGRPVFLALGNQLQDTRQVWGTRRGVAVFPLCLVTGSPWVTVCFPSALRGRKGFSGKSPSCGKTGSESHKLLRVAWTARRSKQSILKETNPEFSLEGLMLKLKLIYFGHLMWRTNSLEITWCWERLKAGGEGGDRGWDGWMVSLTQRTWICANSRRWWTANPGVLHPWGAKSHTWLSNWTTARSNNFRLCWDQTGPEVDSLLNQMAAAKRAARRNIL